MGMFVAIILQEQIRNISESTAVIFKLLLYAAAQVLNCCSRFYLTNGKTCS